VYEKIIFQDASLFCLLITTDASYYAVAAVNKTTRSDLNLYTLNGAKTCHTAIGKTAGWNMPIGWLKRHGFNPGW